MVTVVRHPNGILWHRDHVRHRWLVGLVAACVACTGEAKISSDDEPPSNVGAPDMAVDGAADNNAAHAANPADSDIPNRPDAPTVDVDDSCEDADGDGAYVSCNDFTGIPGPDCDDADADNWNSCASCVDADADGAFAGCDAFTTRAGPDCDDANPNASSTCDTCVDADADGWVGLCDSYDGVEGPDCNDADADNWMSCATCADGDSDGYWYDCDAYSALAGPDCDDGNGAINPGADEIEDNGADDDCNPATPDVTCEYVPNPATNPEPGNLAGITAEHNRWRERVGVPPLTWNPTLAASAEAYAQTCVWMHDPDRSPDAGFGYVGENLYASSQMPSNALVLDAVLQWANERFDYGYGLPIGSTGGAVVGHYTQLVWDDSEEVGCGFAYCPSIADLNFSGTIVACRYGPGGNYTGQTPYGFVSDPCVDLDNDDVLQGSDPDDTDRSVP